MSELSAGSHEQHKQTTVGDAVKMTLENGLTISGTAMDCPGATVYVMTEAEKIFKTRRFTNPAGEQAIMVSADGETVDDETIEEGVNPYGISITNESTTLSLDHNVVDFQATSQTVTLGDE